MAVPVLVQQTSYTLANTGTPRSATLTFGSAVTSGNSVIVIVNQVPSATRTYTTNLTGDTQAVYKQHSVEFGVSTIRYAHNVTTAPSSVVVTANTGTTNFYAIAYEVSGIDTGVAPITSTAEDLAGVTNTHYCAASGEIDTTVESYVFAAAHNAAASTNTETGAWVDDANTSQHFAARLSAATALTDERGQYTGTTNRASAGCLAAFSGSVAAGQPRLARNLTHIYPPARGRMGAWF